MEFVLMTEPQLGMTYDRLLRLARLAERIGLHGFARSDHYAFPRVTAPHATDAFATLAGLARETSSIELSVLVTPITFRHPGVLAKMAATIDEMSGGRFALGVGTGWMEEEHTGFGFEFPAQKERFERLEEALGYFHHAFGRRPGPFHGSHYRLEADEVRPQPIGPLPLLVGGTGERRTPRLAGSHADVYNHVGIRSDDEMRLRIDRARSAAAEAGRDPDELLISVMTPVVVGSDQASFRSNLGRVAEADPFGRDAETISQAYRERGLPIGTADEAGEVVDRLATLGVERMYVQCFGPYDDDFLEETFHALRT